MIYESKPKEKAVCIAEAESAIVKVKKLYENLKNAISHLPSVDKNGYSECPFAEELYKKKQQAAESLSFQMRKLDKYLKWVEDQILKCTNNLIIVSANADKLNGDWPKKDFTDTEVRLAGIYKRLVKLKCQLKRLICESQELLQIAWKRNYETDQDPEYRANQVLDNMVGKRPVGGYDYWAEQRELNNRDEFLCRLLNKDFQVTDGFKNE